MKARRESKNSMAMMVAGCLLAWGHASTMAADAASAAGAGSDGSGRRVATADASYNGNVGFADTATRTGPITLARGVALGVDENGLALSVSHAVAAGDTAVARNLNISLGQDGLAVSGGRSISRGEHERSAEAGGAVQTTRHGTTASATSSGRSDDRGTVRTTTFSRSPRSGGDRFDRAVPRVRSDRSRVVAPRRIYRVRHR